MNPLKRLFSLLPQSQKFYGTLASTSNGKVSVSLIGGGLISYAGETDLAENSKVWLIRSASGDYSISSAPDFTYYDISV